MVNKSKLTYKEKHRQNRIDEKRFKEAGRDLCEKELEIENELLDQEYLRNRINASTKVFKITSRHLMLLVLPAIIITDLLLRNKYSWLYVGILFLMACQSVLIVKFLIQLFESPENSQAGPYHRLYRVERNYCKLALPLLLVSILQILLYYMGIAVLSLIINIILFCGFCLLLVFYGSYIEPKKINGER